MGGGGGGHWWKDDVKFRAVKGIGVLQRAVGSGRGMPGRIVRKAYLGRLAEYVVACDLGEVLALVPSGAALHEVDAPVDLMLGTQGLKVLPD